MKKFLAPALTALMLGAVGTASAQMEDAIALTRTMIQTERQAIVAENLGLTDAQGTAFWPLYRDYTNERARLGDRTAGLVKKYAAAYDVIDDATAAELLDEYLDIQKEDLALRRTWVGKIRKVLPPKLTTRFFQIENKLDAYTRALLADEIPLVMGGKPVTIAPK
jgi:hypothetical protein